ncbi:MAG: cobalamin-binding protein [Dehalococcoidia bacterium]|jgi:iron complex transport system substrate-binding protein
MRLKLVVFLAVLLTLVAGAAVGCNAGFETGPYTDDMGRNVVIEDVPQRIVCFGPSITEIAFALGLGERVVGVDDYSDYPAEAVDLPKVGNAFAPSMESLVALEPDLVLTLEHEQFNSEMEAMGLTYLVIDPADIDGILADIELIGRATDTAAAAEALAEDMETRMRDIEAGVINAIPVSVFFIVDATDPMLPWTAGPGSFIDTLISMAGGINIAHEAPSQWPQFSLEEIVNADPDVIIVQTMLGGIPTIEVSALEEHAIWGGLSAVENGKVYLVDGDLVSRSGPRIVDGLEELARALHPDLFD